MLPDRAVKTATKNTGSGVIGKALQIDAGTMGAIEAAAVQQYALWDA
jgi:hypothetical protein